MANYFFDNKIKQSTIDDRDVKYVYVEDVVEFLERCADNYISDGVDEVGCYTWSDSSYTWEPSTMNDCKAMESEVAKMKEQTGGITKAKENTFVGWNIVITLDSGEVIKTNSEPVDMSEVQEAMNIMLKPSFFGKRIKKFEIVAE